MKRVKKKSVASFLVMVLLGPLLFAHPASADGNMLWWTDEAATFATFGLGQSITISMGTLGYITDCDPSGVNDVWGFSAASIYIVPTKSIADGTRLSDVGGSPNVVQSALSGGLFIDETIGFAGVNGIGTGRYAVVYDQCEDGHYDAGIDDLFDPAFEVVDSGSLPALPSGEIAQIKAQAAVERDRAILEMRLTKLMFLLSELEDLELKIPTPGELLLMLIEKCLSDLFPSIQDILEEQLAVVQTHNVEHWNALAQDPPDPNFANPAAIGPLDIVGPDLDGPIRTALAALGGHTSVTSGAVQVLVSSLEKYQGAAGHDTAAGLMHARNARAYARLVAESLGRQNDAIDDLLAALSATQLSAADLVAQVRPLLDRVRAQGFTPEEQQRFSLLGLTAAQIEQARQDLSATDLQFIQDAGGVAAFLTKRKQEHAATAAAMQDLIPALDSIIADLTAAVADPGPAANAGGPYSGAAGSAIAFNGGASTDPKGRSLTFTWDLDGDGSFDDATGPSASYTFPAPFRGLAGLKVAIPDGRYALAYAPVTVAAVNQPPLLTGISPATRYPQIGPGGSQPFHVDAADPEGGPVTVAWELNGAPAGAGSDFALTAAMARTGGNSVRVEASDAGGA